MELKGKRVMVIGLGVSGLAAARFLARRGGANCVMTDRRADRRNREQFAGRRAASRRRRSGWLDGVDLVVTSPGVPRDVDL